MTSLDLGDALQPIPRRHDVALRIGLDDFTFEARFFEPKEARAMQVQVRVEGVGVEQVDDPGVSLIDVSVPHDILNS